MRLGKELKRNVREVIQCLVCMVSDVKINSKKKKIKFLSLSEKKTQLKEITKQTFNDYLNKCELVFLITS